MKMADWFKGELVGTFLLVFFGCSSVATSVALAAPVGVFQVAIVWGLGLTTAIFVTGKASGAHVNPAITLAFALLTDFPKKRILGYWAAQFLGAFLAACAVYGVFGGAISVYEQAHGIVRGAPGSEATAMIFGEYFPNPGGEPLTETDRATVSHGRALFAEFVGTGLLALVVFGLVDRRNDKGAGRMTPLAIGLALSVLIAVFGPVTMACFNPARDFSPRLFTVLAGWKGVPFTTNGLGWLSVYLIMPCVGALAGGAVAGWLFGSQRPGLSARGAGGGRPGPAARPSIDRPSGAAGGGDRPPQSQEGREGREGRFRRRRRRPQM